jgi:hypothetical protein
MSVHVGQADTGVDRPVQVVVVVTAVLTAIGMLWLVQAAVGGGFPHRTVRVDNQAALPVQVDALDAGGGRLGLGVAKPRATAAFHEVADPGGPWTFVATYGGEEVWRQELTRRELAGRDWRVQVPAEATAALERLGHR